MIGAMHVSAPAIDYQGLAPILATVCGSIAVLLLGLKRGFVAQRILVPFATVASLVAAIGLAIWAWIPARAAPIIEGALSADRLTQAISVLVFVAGIATVVLSLRRDYVREAGTGEFFALLLGSITGMVVLAGSENLVALFIGIELLSIPLYVLCATQLRSEVSLESGLKYLVVGSVGSATLLYGLSLIYGATGSTDLSAIAAATAGGSVGSDPLFLTGVALTVVGFSFKASVAPFHQWTPDVYQGAPTSVTAFMAVATKAAALAIFLRMFVVAAVGAQADWGPAIAALAVATILIGNVGAITQRSLKRLLAWSGVAQAGYMLAGVVVGTRLGLEATVLYLGVYLVMNISAFAVVIARERLGHGDDLASIEGLGASNPVLAWPMTIAMLALAGFPATAGFIGKFYLIEAAVGASYVWLGIAIAVGSIISLAYYLRVVAVMWMAQADLRLPFVATGRIVKPAGGSSPEADSSAQFEVAAVAVLAAALTIAGGLFPSPLFDAVSSMGGSLVGLH
jgi:NADH-quinone oxidoreductase subunit N